MALLVGYGLRVYHLDFQASLSDDAFSLTLAREPPWDVVRVSAREPHPPVYYLLLSVWHVFAGDREFAGRYTGLAFGVLGVAAAWALGARVLGPGAGLAAAWLTAINPFLVDFSQTARMYTMAVFLVCCSLRLAYRLLCHHLPPWRLVALYAAVSWLAMATHFFAFWVIVAQGFGALACAPRRLSWWLRWAVGQAAIGLAYLPWLVYAREELLTYTNTLVSTRPLGAMLVRTLTVFTIGWSRPAPLAAGLAILSALLCASGLIALTSGKRSTPSTRHPTLVTRQSSSVSFIALQALAPFVAVWAVSLVRPMFYERYMVVAWPAWALLAAAGLAAWGRLARPVAALGAGAMGVASLGVLWPSYHTALYARSSDVRALVAYALSVPDPAVVVSVPPSDPFYRYYFPSSTALVYSSTLGFPDEAAAARSLEALAHAHPFVWFLPFANATWDPHNLVYTWLSGHTYPAGSRWFGNAQVFGYAAGPPLAWEDAPPLDPPLLLGPTPDGPPLVALRGLRFAPDHVAPGAPLYLLLQWEARAPLDKDYNVFVHVVDSRGKLVAQQDGQPVAGLRPTRSWKPGEPILDRHAVAAPWPPGDLHALVGLYDPANGHRLAFRFPPTGHPADAYPAGSARREGHG